MSDFLEYRHSKQGQIMIAEALAKKYVRRGAFWLYEHAPKGWYRNCLDGTYSRIHTCRTNEGPPAIAFEFCPEYADEFGYVVEWKVQKRFGIPTYSRASHRLGFDTPLNGYRPYRRYPEILITSEMLDAAWQTFLNDIPSEWRIMYRHPRNLDERFAKLDFSRNQPGFWRRLLFGWRRRASAF